MVRIRSTAVWAVATVALVALGLLTWPVVTGLGAALRDPAGSAVAEAVVGASAATGLLAGCWLWLVTTDVVASVLRPRSPRLPRRLVATPVRALVLAACGVAVVGGPASAAPLPPTTSVVVPVERDPGAPPLLDGLPLPDRPVGGEPRAPGRVRSEPSPEHGPRAPHPSPRDVTPSTAESRVRVAPGDSLWAIAERVLGPRATVAEVAAYWHRIHDLNADVVGPDPDLVHPGQLLRLPPHP